jgi:hypothetical protein
LSVTMFVAAAVRGTANLQDPLVVSDSQSIIIIIIII